MDYLTHSGTRALFGALLFSVALLASSACGDDSSAKNGKPAQDAGSFEQCQTPSDCTLIGKGCCGSCEPDKSAVVAVLHSKVEEEREQQCPGSDPSCGACEVKVYDPKAPYLQAGCEAGVCVVLDLREQDVTACKAEADCEVAAQGCCGACSADPAQWHALKKGATHPAAQGCKDVACDACLATIEPVPFCADDGHCALRDNPAVDSVPSMTCFSPSQNLEKAYDDGAVGCDCFEVGAAVCVKDGTNRAVALICQEDRSWHAVEDGPCFPGGA